MKNRGSSPPKEHPHNISSKSVKRFEGRSRKTKNVHADDDNNDVDDGHRVIARVTLTR